MFLAVSTLVAIRMDPTELGHSWAAYGLFVFYMANGILILMLLRRRQQSTAAFRLLVHAGDIVWPALISIFAEGPENSFLPLLLLRAGGGGLPLGALGNAGDGGRRSGVVVD